MGLFDKLFGSKAKGDSGNKQTTNNVGVGNVDAGEVLKQLNRRAEEISEEYSGFFYEETMKALKKAEELQRRSGKETDEPQSKLDIFTEADSKNTTIGNGEEALENDDEWTKEWIEGYDTSQEYGLKRIMQELKKSKYMDEEMYEFIMIECYDEERGCTEILPKWKEFCDRHEKISSVCWQLEQMLAKCKQRRRELKTTTDPELDERKTDRLGNPIELTPIEFATQKIEELIHQGIIDQEIANECNIHISYIERDDDYDEDILIEDVT